MSFINTKPKIDVASVNNLKNKVGDVLISLELRNRFASGFFETGFLQQWVFKLVFKSEWIQKKAWITQKVNSK